MAKTASVRIDFFGDNDPVEVTTIEIPEGVYNFIKGMALSIDGEDIIRIPLNIHSDSLRYHTICTVGSTDIEGREW